MQSAEQLNSTWDGDAAGYDALRNTWLNQRRDLYCLDFLKAAQPGDTVFELGSGTGSSLIWLAQQRPDLLFVGIEPLKNYCDYGTAKAKELKVGNVEFLCGYGEDAQRILENRPRATWIISTDVLHHVKDLRLTAEQMDAISAPTAKWLSFEPSYLNPYIFYYQATAPGERNFWPGEFLKAAESTWRLNSKSYITVIPSFVPNPSPVLKAIERALEGVPVVCGRRVSVLSKVSR